MIFQTFVVASSLCEEIIVWTFVERIEVHEIFMWLSFELKRGFYISAYANFVCASFRSERTEKKLSTHGSNVFTHRSGS